VKGTYQDPCHLAHGQRIRSAPRDLLRAVGMQLEEMPHPDQCCGSAGSYNITQNDLSMKILDEKMKDIACTSAELVVTGNVGCMLQLRAGMKRANRNIPVKHVVEVLDSCYESS
jgi:glycolate oxidase iron-sulfur subunit